MDGMDGMGWDGSPGGPRYRAPTVLINWKLYFKSIWQESSTKSFFKGPAGYDI